MREPINVIMNTRNPGRFVVRLLITCCICAVYIFFEASRAEAQIANIAMAELYISIMQASEDWLQRAGEIALGLLAVTAVIGFAISVKDLALSGNITLDGIVVLLVRHALIVGLIV